jgi:hypothetical protein
MPSSERYATIRDFKVLLFRDWINHAWTHQEILLATNPVIVCGHFHVLWFSFERSTTLLASTGPMYTGRMLRGWNSIIFGRDRLQVKVNHSVSAKSTISIPHDIGSGIIRRDSGDNYTAQCGATRTTQATEYRSGRVRNLLHESVVYHSS